MNGWWLSEPRRIGGEIRGFSPKAGTRVSSCRSFWSEKNTRPPPFYSYRKSQTIGLAQIGVGFCFKPLVWPKSEVGFASNHWFGSNRGRVLLQTTWFDPNRGSVLLQTTWFDPNRRSVLPQTTWFGSNRGCDLHQTTWFGLNRGRVCFKPPGLAPIGVGLCFKSNTDFGSCTCGKQRPCSRQRGNRVLRLALRRVSQA